MKIITLSFIVSFLWLIVPPAMQLAAAPKLPESLVGQLAVGGRLLAPVGPRSEQKLIKALYTEEGLAFQALGPCRFVPLIGEQAFSED